MNPQLQSQVHSMLQLLEGAAFSYPVAIYQGDDPEIGDVLEADAFDVPSTVAIAISQRLCEILWPVGFVPMTVLPGIIHDFESVERREDLPPETVWYLPAKTIARNSVPSS